MSAVVLRAMLLGNMYILAQRYTDNVVVVDALGEL